MPLIETKGAASAQGFGEFAKTGEAVYIESCFSTWLYTGNSSTQTITNGIDLSTKGGLVWVKRRSAAGNNILADTNRGASAWLSSNLTNGQGSDSTKINSFTSSGFVVGSDSTTGSADNNYASWTFRKQPKFFDIVTYTGDGTNNRQISHSLGSTPGFIIVKNYSGTQSWLCYHRSLGTGNYLFLNGTDANTVDANAFPSVTSTTFTPTANQSAFSLNANGVTYVAYLFAHNAGGFGLTGTDNVISCGSFTTNGSAVSGQIELGWEPQFLLIKRSSGTGNWMLIDNMRGVTATGNGGAGLYANLTNAEDPSRSVNINATGFSVSGDFGTSSTSIYIAIRRGPMKTPTTGTSVFQPFVNYTSIGNQVNGTMGPVDLGLQTQVPTPFSAATHFSVFDRLRGSQKLLATSVTNAEGSGNVFFDTNTGIRNESWFTNGGVGYNFRRAPGFFDVVCADTAGTTNHNLGVVPELIIMKRRDGIDAWYVVSSGLGSINADFIRLNTDQAKVTAANNQIAATSTTFNTTYFRGAGTWVNYLFASCPGVSKVFSFTGNGSSQTINCGFTGGSRLVLIKRTDSTGNWVIFDSARGIVAGNDPALYLNSTAAEVTGVDAIDTDSTGFIVNQETTFNLNVNNATYIGLAIS